MEWEVSIFKNVHRGRRVTLGFNPQQVLGVAAFSKTCMLVPLVDKTRSLRYTSFNPQQVLGVIATTDAHHRKSITDERTWQDFVFPYNVCWFCTGPRNNE